MSSTKPTITLKLLVDSEGKRVVFAEAEKDFVDFLVSLMSLPIGTVIKLLSANDMVGSLGKLYKSFENLNDNYIQPEANKDAVLKPASLVFEGAAKLLSLPKNAGPVVYTCGNCRHYVTYNPKDKCPYCSHTMSTPANFGKQTAEASATGGGGYVKEAVTYIILDDLEVKPMSTISCISLLNKYNVKELGDVEEMVVSVGMAEVCVFFCFFNVSFSFLW